MTSPDRPPLGRLPTRLDPRTFRAARYLRDVTPPPLAVDYGTAAGAWPMYANDRAGDCTLASVGHTVQSMTAYAASAPVTLPEDDILAAYTALTGYDPATGANDTGCVELDVLNYWRKTGVGGHRIVAYAALDLRNHDEVRQALHTLGSLYIGANMPNDAWPQFAAGQPWHPTDGPDSEPGSWGGHAVNIVAYGPMGLTCITWGRPQQLTWAWWDRYVEEAYAVVTDDWLSRSGQSPTGLDLAGLQADLAAIAADQPNIEPEPAPVPPPEPAPPAPEPPVSVPLAADVAAALHRAAVRHHRTDQQQADVLLRGALHMHR